MSKNISTKIVKYFKKIFTNISKKIVKIFQHFFFIYFKKMLIIVMAKSQFFGFNILFIINFHYFKR